MIKFLFPVLVLFFGSSFGQSEVSLVVLGTVQDGGSPHIGCNKSCCESLFRQPDATRNVVSLGLIDHKHQKTFVFEATPNMPEQLHLLKKLAGFGTQIPNGILLTHAHMGHYTGLMFLGREAYGAQSVPVYAMPKMERFLQENGPWSQLVTLNNIDLITLVDAEPVNLTPNITVLPFLVPHRDEFSETVGYEIKANGKTVLFIPDIDKWERWATPISEKIKQVDFAFLDATFFDAKEINNRPIAEIPHPFVIESMQLFKSLSGEDKAKIHFIHFNHTNPLLRPQSKAYKAVTKEGFKVAHFGQRLTLWK